MHAIAKALRALPDQACLLAVSGGRDSMAMMHAFAAFRPGLVAGVATFDHGTGVAATTASALAAARAEALGFQVAHAIRVPPSDRRGENESRWRTARWGFLRVVAEQVGVPVATAHTRDDQAETVAIRILRGASARGLAGMAAESPGIIRPLLDVSRRELADWAARHEVPFVEDPSNASSDHLRNRLRADLLRAAGPSFVDALVEIGAGAAAWRQDVARLVDQLGPSVRGSGLTVSAAALRPFGPSELAVLWPELAGRIGLAMDRRGIARAAAWSVTARSGQRIQLSGGGEIVRTRTTFAVRRPDETPEDGGNV